MAVLVRPETTTDMWVLVVKKQFQFQLLHDALWQLLRVVILTHVLGSNRFMNE
jgi:hypothetical protein